MKVGSWHMFTNADMYTLLRILHCSTVPSIDLRSLDREHIGIRNEDGSIEKLHDDRSRCSTDLDLLVEA